VLERRLAHDRAGVGDERVDPLEPLDGPPRLIGIGEVDAGRAFRGLDVPAVGAKAFGDPAADPASGAGDEDNSLRGVTG
jgi:hypothetical protein